MQTACSSECETRDAKKRRPLILRGSRLTVYTASRGSSLGAVTGKQRAPPRIPRLSSVKIGALHGPECGHPGRSASERNLVDCQTARTGGEGRKAGDRKQVTDGVGQIFRWAGRHMVKAIPTLKLQAVRPTAFQHATI